MNLWQVAIRLNYPTLLFIGKQITRHQKIESQTQIVSHQSYTTNLQQIQQWRNF